MTASKIPRILVVDDNPFNRVLISDMVKLQGFAVTEANDGKEALSRIQKNDFDLIILDLLMPGMDGFETARHIRKMGLSVPIVAVSALALKQDRLNSLKAGCNDFLSKPLDFKGIQSILKKYVKERSEERKTEFPSLDNGASSSPPPLFKGGHLILVEENQEQREQYASLLSQSGFRVKAVANGTEASRYIEKTNHAVQMVISNIFTSGIDGLGLLAIIKRQYAHILVFLYTQSYNPATFQYAVQQKVDGIIPQDQFESIALEIIESALSQSRRKGSRISDAKTAELVRKAQDQLVHPGCLHSCSFLDVAYQSLHEAGGDMMRYHNLDLDGRCGIVLADVAGHDVMSSYTSATFTGILMSLWDNHKDPLALLQRINSELIKVGNDKSHVCATAMVWERWSGRLQIVSAGNPGALILTIDPTGKPVFKNLTGGGMVLGILENSELFQCASAKLDGDAYLFLFTDGIETDALMAAIETKLTLFDGKKIRGRGICQQLIDTILEKNEQEDDMILLCIQHDEKWGSPDSHSGFLSTYEEVDRACAWIDRKLTVESIPMGNDRDLILLAARETILNAVEHGNDLKSTAHFEVSLYFLEHELRIKVLDEGSGFCLEENVCKPCDVPLKQIGKRGLGLTASIAQEILVEEGAVTLVFNEVS